MLNLALFAAAALVTPNSLAQDPLAQDPLALDPRLVFGQSETELNPVFETLCERHDLVVLDPAELPIAQSRHEQVNCTGFHHAGRLREAEFVFADGALAFVWVLTDAEEEAAHLATMRASYGAPTHDTALFVAFADHNTALRRDVPEFLYYSDAIAPMYRGWFDQMAAQ